MSICVQSKRLGLGQLQCWSGLRNGEGWLRSGLNSPINTQIGGRQSCRRCGLLDRTSLCCWCGFQGRRVRLVFFMEVVVTVASHPPAGLFGCRGCKGRCRNWFGYADLLDDQLDQLARAARGLGHQIRQHVGEVRACGAAQVPAGFGGDHPHQRVTALAQHDLDGLVAQRVGRYQRRVEEKERRPADRGRCCQVGQQQPRYDGRGRVPVLRNDDQAAGRQHPPQVVTRPRNQPQHRWHAQR